MRMYPSVVHDGTESGAERQVFELLKATDLGRDAYALHSLHLARHDEKRMAEADFVVVSAHGVLVLEVKGGQVSCNGGIWNYRDRHGEDHRSSEGPFHQAKSAMFALQKALEQRGHQASQVRFGYAVVTPHTNLPSGVEWPEEVMIGHSQMGRESLEGALSTAWDHWRRVESDGRRKDIDPTTAKWLRQQMQPDFDRVPLLGAVAEGLERSTARLTEGQLIALDLVADHPRVLVRGGAGSGKTFLAAEAARRGAIDGPTLFVVHSDDLAAWLRLRLDDVTVMAADRLPDSGGRTYRTLVVDEAQDVMSIDMLDRFDAALEGGLTEGTWRVFADVDNQVGVVGTFEQEAWDYLCSLAPPPMRLSRNCRNTSNIVEEMRRTLGADLGVADAGEGPKVLWEHGPPEHIAERLTDRLRDLADQDVPRGHSVILTAGDEADRVLELMPADMQKGIGRLSVAHLGSPTAKTMVSEVGDFKGLEAHFVHLIGVPARLEDDDIARLYVAMSRARSSLWVGCSDAAFAAVQQQIVTQLTKATP